jgi:GntR family transcriptional regulator
MPASAEHPRRAAVAAAGRRLRADRARQLADLLRREVLSSDFPDGVLPHEDELVAEYGASRNTVRQALDLLRGEGLVSRVPGVGTIVACPQKARHGLTRLIERLRRLDGLPLSLDQTYLPVDVGLPLLDCDLERSDVFGLLEDLTAQRLGTAEIALEAVNADAHAASTLEAPRGAALLMLERLTHLDDGRPVDLEFIRFRGDRITMTGVLQRGGGS